MRGFGLIEVLIALVVVSFGVLGMAGLQLSGMRHSAGGLERTKALLFAENMATRMRINAPGVAAGDYANFDSNAWTGSCSAAPSPYCQASVGSGGDVIPAERCDTDELAAFDLWSVVCGDRGVDSSGAAVGRGVVDTLPNGQLQIDCDAADCAVYTVTVRWSENDARAAAGTPAASKRVQLRLRP